MKKSLFIIVIFSLLISCANKKERMEIKTEIKASEENTAESQLDSKLTIQHIQNDSITHSWVLELTKISKNDKKFEIQQELRPNRHWDYMDTIKTLTFDKSRLTLISTKDYFGLWTAELKNPEIPLWNYIKVGMNKSQLEKTLATKIPMDKVEIGNLEQTTTFVFEFKNNNLDRINFVGFED